MNTPEFDDRTAFGLTSKLNGKQLVISLRTVGVYRARLRRKLGATTTADLMHKLLIG